MVEKPLKINKYKKITRNSLLRFDIGYKLVKDGILSNGKPNSSYLCMDFNH